MGLLILTPQMRVYTVFSIFFFLISSLFLSTEGLSLAKKEKAGAVSTKAKGAEADTGEQTETADSNDKAEGKDSEDSETLDLKVETVEKVETKEGQPAEAETKEGLGGADGKSKILGLITKLKEMNVFLKEMVTYWDKLAGGKKALARDADADADADAKDEKSGAEDEAAAGDAEDEAAAGGEEEKTAEGEGKDGAETEKKTEEAAGDAAGDSAKDTAVPGRKRKRF